MKEQPNASTDRVAAGNELRRPLWKWLFLPLRLLFKLWFAFIFGLSLLVLYVPFRLLLRDPSGYKAAFRLMQGWGHFLAYGGLVPLRVEQRSPWPDPPYVVCINHSSYIDIVHTFCLVPHYFLFMGKHELLRWPLFNIFFHDMHIAVNRSNGMEAARALKKAGDALEAGACVSIFPEGTISAQAPRLLPFKDGAFRLAIRKQVPIVPVTLLDNWYMFGDPEKPLSAGRPGISRAIVHAAVPTRGLAANDAAALRERIFRQIEAPLQQAYPAK